MHDFLDHVGHAFTLVCMRCGLAEGEPGWHRCYTPYVTHSLRWVHTDSIQRNNKTGRIMQVRPTETT